MAVEGQAAYSDVMTDQLKAILWAIAVFYALSAPLALLFGVDWWRIVAIVVFEFLMMILLSVWMRK